MASTVLNGLDEIRGAVGAHLGYSEWLTIDQHRVNLFAEATGDHQWIHVDVERAKDGPFGGPIAHGYLTLSLLPMLSQGRKGVKIQLGGKMGVNYGLNKVRFTSPVRVGKRIRVRTTLLAVDEIGDKAVQMTNLNTIEIEGEDRPACVAETLGRTYF